MELNKGGRVLWGPVEMRVFNGLEIARPNQYGADYVYNEIFEDSAI